MNSPRCFLYVMFLRGGVIPRNYKSAILIILEFIGVGIGIGIDIDSNN